MNQIVSAISIFVLGVHPVLAQSVTAASGVNGPAIIQTANGIDMVMINAPDANGVSLNQYTNFDVPATGVILNNADTDFVLTQQAGYVQGNTNLIGGAAGIIINEVTTNNPSSLNGFLEVAGVRADVIVANPYGITCDGCGFINTDRMVLTTGTPTFSAGVFTGLSVDDGAINIGAGGLNAYDSTRFDLISRQITVAGSVAGHRLRIIAGRNDVIYATDEVIEKADDGSAKPALAIDSTVLGGMYGDAITIVSTEDGVGVRAPDDLAANAGSMVITSDGRLVFRRASAVGSITATSTQGDVVVEESLVATLNVDITSANDLIVEADAKLVSQSALIVDTAGSLTLGANAQLAAGGSITTTSVGDITLSDGSNIVSYGDVSLTGANLATTGEATIAAGARDGSGNIQVASLNITVSDSIDLTGALAVSSGTLDVTARIIDIAEDGVIPAGRFVGSGDVSLSADTITAGVDGVAFSESNLSIAGANGALQTTGGTFQAIGNVSLSADSLNVASDFQSLAGTLSVSAINGDIDNIGRLLSNNGIVVSATDTFTNTGQVQAGGNALISADTIINSASTGGGVIQSLNGGVLLTAATDITNELDAILHAVTGLYVYADGTLTNAGEITSDGTMLFRGNVNAELGDLQNLASGEIVATGTASIAVTSLTNAGAIASSAGQLGIWATGNITNTGLMYADSLLALFSDAVILNDGGALVANQNLQIAGNTGALAIRFTNQNGGLVETFSGDISIAATTIENLSPLPVFGTDIIITTDFVKSGHCITTGMGSQSCLRTTTTTTVTTDNATVSGPIAQIISGGSIFLSGGDATNQYGLISATANIGLNLVSFTNAGVDLNEVTEVVRDYHRTHKSCFFACIITGNTYWTEVDAPTVVAIGSVFSTVEAGGTISGIISGYLTNGAVLENTAVTGGTNPNVIVATTTPGTASLTTISVDVSAIDPTAVGNPNLFVANTDPDASFLLETRYAFIDISQFLSSDYFLSSITFDPDITQKRLGDAYVETQFIRDQLFQLNGTRLGNAGMDERDIIKAMYDGAIDAAQSLDLKPGIALTPEQIAALTEDIIWLEEIEVNGQMVLVPHLYLASAVSLAAAQTGATIQAVDIALMVGEFTNNGGLVAANNSLMLQATGDILNLGGTLMAGDLLSLNTLGDLYSISGMISGANVAIVAENIFIETASLRSGDEENFAEAAGLTSTIQASETLYLGATNDITLTGAAIFAGGDASIFAGGDITIGALALAGETNTEWNESGFGIFGSGTSSGSSHTESLTHQVSTIDVGGNLTIISTGEAVDDENTGNVIFEGAQVSAGGDMQIAALQGSVILAAVQDTYYSDMQTDNSAFLFSNSSRSQSFDLTNQVTELTAGNIDIYAAGSIIIEATTFNVGLPIGALVSRGSDIPTGNLTLTSEFGDIAFLAVTDIHATSYQSESEILWGLAGSNADIRTLTTTSFGSTANVSGDITLNSGRDLTLTAVDFTAGGSFTTNVEGDTYLLAAIDTDYRSLMTMNNNAIIITNTTSEDLTQSATFNSITASGGISFDADSAVTFDAYRDAIIDSAHPAAWVGDSNDRLAIAGAYLGWESATGGEDQVDGEEDAAHWRSDDKWSDEQNLLIASLPTAADGAGYGYIGDLLERDSTVNNTIELLDYHFYEQHQQLSPAFQALVSLAVSYVTGGLGLNLSPFMTAFVNSAATQLIAGMVSGDLDLGQILGNALFAGVSSWATNLISVDTLGLNLGPNADLALLGFGNDLTLTGIVDAGINSAITSGLSSIVYGTDFAAGFLQSFGSSLVSLAMADFQTLIGDQELTEGGFEHAFLHGLVGCVAAELSNADCAAGAVGGIAQSLYAGYLDANGLDLANKVEMATLIGGLAGFFVSGGEGENVSFAAAVASSAIVNNYLTHSELAMFENDLRDCIESGADCSEIISEYKELSAKHDAEFNACNGDSECIHTHLVQIAAAEMSGKFDLVMGLLENSTTNPSIRGTHLGDFEKLQFSTAEAVASGVDMEAAWEAAGARYRSEFESAACSTLSASECQTAFDVEVQLLAEDAIRRGENLDTIAAFFGGIGIVIDFTPGLGDVKGFVECGVDLSMSTCLGAVAGLLPLLGDGARIALRRGDDLVEVAAIGGDVCVYSCVIDGVTRYVGITNDVKRRGGEHLLAKGFDIEGIPGLSALSRADAKAVEQVLINYHGLGKYDGTLMNMINSISPTRNPTAYEQALLRGAELLENANYPGFN